MTTQDLQTYRPQRPQPQRPQPAGLDHMIGEFLFLVFRHKWKITVFTLLGLAAAGYLWVTTPTVYRSTVRILVRYIAENTGGDPANVSGRVVSPDRGGGTS